MSFLRPINPLEVTITELTIVLNLALISIIKRDDLKFEKKLLNRTTIIILRYHVRPPIK